MRKLAIVLALMASLVLPVSAAAAGPRHLPAKPEISVDAPVMVEGDGAFEVKVSLSRATWYPVFFKLKLKNDGEQRVNLNWARHRWFWIDPGETEKVIELRVKDDEKLRADSRIKVKVKKVWGAKRGDIRDVGVVYDNDGGKPGKTAFELTALHVNDHHSHLAEEDIELMIGGEELEFELGGFARVVTQIEDRYEALRKQGENVVKVHAGDAITGTLFYTLFLGEADAAMMNEVCFDIFELGNHEFDGSDQVLADFLDDLNSGDCGTVTLAANIKPAIGTPLAPVGQNDYLRPFVVKKYGHEKVGFIGIDIAGKTQGSSSPLDTTEFFDELETSQFYIDELTKAGVDNIVLVTHYGYDNDLALASNLVGVDAIIGGDSHSLLGDFEQYGLSPEGPYPTITTDAVGHQVCVVQAWQYSWVVGELAMAFDEDGRINTCGGTPYLLLGDQIVDEPTAAAPVIDDPQLAFVTPDADALETLAAYEAEVEVLGQQVIGAATEDICLARFPDDGRSTLCAVGTLPNGGEIQQLVTEAFLDRAFRADIALQNSGGVRIDIPAGDITIADVYTLLPFANTIFELEMTGAEIKLALEQGMDWALNPDGSTGAFPYGAGIRWDLDASAESGSRFDNIEVMPKGATDWVLLQDDAVYIVAANSFMAGGGDGYSVLEDVVNDGRGVDTFLDYAQSFIDWIVEDQAGTISKPTEYSLKSFTPA
ncbi:MAG: 5'-nucleotidase C-terminal domain-containing protein [Acidimicrobiia bacterium]|nr:5'-nucleotidase C-terminal domain-containing protein [Acidimicrobiia bacterium]